MRYRILSYLFVIALVSVIGDWFYYETHAHDLTVRVPAVGPVEPGQPPPTTEVPVAHEHQCVPREVGRTTLPGGLVERVVYDHRKILTEAEIAAIRTQAEAWIRDNGGGNSELASPPTNEKNCHGVTFDGGNSWVNDISDYLRNCTRWSPPPAQPPVGTVVVYRNQGRVTHSGRVIATPPGKAGVWVHSQWGHWGDFNHRVDVVHEIYGTGSYYTCH